MNTKIEIILEYRQFNTIKYSNDNIISFYYYKDRYSPYSIFKASMYVNDLNNDICEIRSFVNKFPIHHGPIDTYTVKQTPNGKIATITSKSFSFAMLCNELKEGIIYNATMQSVYDSFRNLFYVYIPVDTKPVGYVYIPEHQSLWDALVVTALKGNHVYPFMSNLNALSIKPLYDFLYTFDKTDKIIEYGYLQNYNNIYDYISMRDVEGNYDYLYENNFFADSRLISRSRYVNYDKQWLEKPDHGLAEKIAYSMRGVKGVFMTYAGFSGEDLLHKFIINTNSFNIPETEISAIVITGNNKGIFTKLIGYYDLYCNTQQFNSLFK